MTPETAMIELLARVGAGNDTAVLVSDEELSHWPAAAVKAMKSQKLLVKARPAAGVVFPGCERECIMPVHTQPAGRQYSLLGDAELDEGAVWEAIVDLGVAELGEVVWVVDVNRQSLDRVVP